ncbi:MAG: type II toxin-antitoxin system ParD family antitoxin [Planctomycetes bacterium]|nr:type II toxin-antitoxin system ParD family antitoxin [Planctomycetota bacterium]
MGTPRRAVSLSISLTPELASEVSIRVESGLYTSASELVREALRMLLRSQARGRVDPLGGPSSADSSSIEKFGSASDLMDAGAFLRASKDPELRERLRELEESQEVGPGLRIASDRLAKLKLDEPRDPRP